MISGFKVALILDDRYLSSRDESFVLTVSSDLQEFIDGHSSDLHV